MLIAGIDDAGRGAVIGPLVIAGVTFQDHQIPILLNLRVKDSKVLTSNRRTILSHEIKKLAIKWEVLEISPYEVDKIVLNRVKFHKLNWLEAVKMAEVIKRLNPETAYVDASDVNEARFAEQIKTVLHLNTKIISKHKADVNYPVVSAASIIAKVHRDESIALLREKYGNFGSGYPSDPKTIKFLRSFINKREFPDCVRKSWKTIERLMIKRNDI